MNYIMSPAPLSRVPRSGVIRIAEIGKLESEIALPADAAKRLSIFNRKKSGKIKLSVIRKKLQAGAYKLDISRGGVKIYASDPDGARYGVRRLEQLLREARSDFCCRWDAKEPEVDPGVLSCQTISDAPFLPMRGMHFYFPALRHLTFAEHLALLDTMAAWNLNTVIFEYANRFPYAGHKIVSAPDAFSRKQVRELITRARRLGLNVIPLHQSLGHVEFILRHAAYSGLREEERHRDQWCPLNPKSIALFKEMADEVLDLHGAGDYFHIGGDEARRLGVCPACAETAKKEGIGKLYLDFIRQAANHIFSRGLTPIIWDDMVCRHIEVLDQLPRAIPLMYWEYWTTKHPSAMFVARPDGFGQVMDRRWQRAWLQELDPVERRMLDHFGRPLDMAHELSSRFLKRFRKYLGAGFPKRVRAFPYLEYYRDHGFKVICAGAASANHSSWRGLPDFPRYADNLFSFARRAKESGAMGLIATTWYSMPFEAYAASIMYAGQASWAGEGEDTPRRRI
ncbi:MAG: family 20 glycosylhydrolase [Kiritimatiellae bacterium]|nr:family 20 glycosylhydrolase [Kiritimatiellia bacterium]